MQATDAVADYGNTHKEAHQRFAELGHVILHTHAVLHGLLLSRAITARVIPSQCFKQAFGVPRHSGRFSLGLAGLAIARYGDRLEALGFVEAATMTIWGWFLAA